MDTLIAELTRLYLSAPAAPGQAVDLVMPNGHTRAIVIPFVAAPGKRDGEDAQHWQRLCDVANALQAQFDFPAPAVSVSASGGYRLWLSLAAPVPVAETRRFLERLGQTTFPDMTPRLEALAGPVELPPCLHRDNGKWSAFIHPGMGASFADESGLDMPPPAAGQLAFLEDLHSIGMAQWQAALARLEEGAAVPVPVPVAAPAAVPAQPQRSGAATPEGLLLKDATLEDIVRLLQARNIEPTFRFLMP